MPEYNQPVWMRKGRNPTTRLIRRESGNLSGGNYEYLRVSNTTTSGEFQYILKQFSALMCV